MKALFLAAILPLTFSPTASRAGTVRPWAAFCDAVGDLRLADELTATKDAASLTRLFDDQRCGYFQEARKAVVIRSLGPLICLQLAGQPTKSLRCSWTHRRNYRP